MRPDTLGAYRYIAYDQPVPLVQVDGTASTNGQHVLVIDGDLRALPAAGVAAKTTPELASGLERTGSALSKSDPFHRSVSWVVDNPAAQRFGIKGGDGVARDLYQLPGEVNGKSGVFERIIDRSGARVLRARGVSGIPLRIAAPTTPCCLPRAGLRWSPYPIPAWPILVARAFPDSFRPEPPLPCLRSATPSQ